MGTFVILEAVSGRPMAVNPSWVATVCELISEYQRSSLGARVADDVPVCRLWFGIPIHPEHSDAQQDYLDVFGDLGEVVAELRGAK